MSTAKLFHTSISHWAKRLNKTKRQNYELDDYLRQVLVGNILGDTSAKRKSIPHNTYLYFKQGLIHEAYIFHLYDLFKDYCPSGPKYNARKPDFRTGKIYSRVYFLTYSLPCFNYYYDLFYVNGVKKIPLNIGELLTPVGLAYWAMDDGCIKSSGFIFCTDSYTLSEVELLIKVFKENFDLN